MTSEYKFDLDETVKLIGTMFPINHITVIDSRLRESLKELSDWLGSHNLETYDAKQMLQTSSRFDPVSEDGLVSFNGNDLFLNTEDKDKKKAFALIHEFGHIFSKYSCDTTKELNENAYNLYIAENEADTFALIVATKLGIIDKEYLKNISDTRTLSLWLAGVDHFSSLSIDKLHLDLDIDNSEILDYTKRHVKTHALSFEDFITIKNTFDKSVYEEQTECMEWTYIARRKDYQDDEQIKRITNLFNSKSAPVRNTGKKVLTELAKYSEPAKQALKMAT